MMSLERTMPTGANQRTAATLQAWLFAAVLGIAMAACDRPTSAPPPSQQPEPATASNRSPTPAGNVAAPTGQQAPDLTLPGAFKASTTLDELRQRFGTQNLTIEKIPLAEGEETDGVILYRDDPSRRAYVYLRDAQDHASLNTILISDANSKWTTSDGIGMGMPLADLVQRNGAPIRFHGLGWDYGGTIDDWNGGRLAPAESGSGRLLIRLSPRPNLDKPNYPLGDGLFSSDDPNYPTAGQDLVVGEFALSFPEQASP